MPRLLTALLVALCGGGCFGSHGASGDETVEQEPVSEPMVGAAGNGPFEGPDPRCAAGTECAGRDFEGCNLTGQYLGSTDCTGANMRNASIGPILVGADMTGVDMTGADLTGAFTNAITWSNTTCPDETNSDANGGTCEGHLVL